jgi:HlyD family secretion protein
LKILTRPGETTTTLPLLRFGDTRNMIALAEVYETDVNRIKIDDPAEVEFQDVPSGGAAATKLTGKVTRIGQLVTPGSTLDLNPAANADRRVIDVRIDLDNASSAKAAQYVNRQVRVIIKTTVGGR